MTQSAPPRPDRTASGEPPLPGNTVRSPERPNLTWIKHGIWLAILGYSGVAVFAYSQRHQLSSIQYPVSTVVIALLSLVIMRRRPSLAAWLVLLTVWWELTLTVYVAGTFIDAAMLVYPLLVSAAGLLVGSRGSIILGSVSVVGVALAGFSGGMTAEQLAQAHGKEGFWLFVATLCMLGAAILTRAALRSYSAALSGSERDRLRYLSLFAHLPEGLIGLNPAGAAIESNAAAARLLGLSRAELDGQPIAGILQRVGLGPHFDLARARDRQQLIELAIGTEGRPPLVLELSVQPTQIPEEPTLLILRDVTQRKLIESHLGHAQRLEAVGQLAGGIAHDFNNLLTAIGGSAEMIALDGDPSSQEMAKLILTAQKRGSNLTRQLLAFARRDVHQPEAIDLAATVRGMTGLVERLLGKQHQLQLTGPAPVWISADDAQIEQVVLNMVTNACDAMPGGGLVGITVRELTGTEAQSLGSRLDRDRQALLEFADTGTGIAPELQARIFEPFFTTKPRGKGTGLGLSAVQGIVAQSQGFLALASRLGAGSRFRIFFTCVPPPGPQNAPIAPVAPSGFAAPPGALARNRLLLVDDEEVVRTTAAHILRQDGYEVVVAPDAESALHELGQCGPLDLVLTDLAMPGMNGRELGDRIHTLHPELPILYMSGYFNDPGVSPFVLAPEAGFLPKPFSRDQLLAAVHAACRR